MSNYMNSIKVLRAPKSKFNLSYDHKTTCDMGQLIPIGNWLCYPGDKIKISNKAVIRTQPLVAPMLHRIKIKVEAFFVPFRLIWDDWEDFITGGKDGTAAPAIPLWDDYYTAGQAPAKYSLWDYFARNTLAINNSTKDPDKNFVPHDLLRRAYNFIYNNYYINRNIQNDVSLTNNDVLYRNFKNDYFASALPFRQRGIDPAISLSFNDVPIVWDPMNTKNYQYSIPTASTGMYGDSDTFVATMVNTGGVIKSKHTKLYNDIALQVADTGQGVTVGTPTKNDGLMSPNIAGKRVKFTGKGWINEQSGTYLQKDGTKINGVDVTQDEYNYINQQWQTLGMRADNSNLASTFNADELRMLMQTKKYLERNARAGSRYTEQLLARWGMFAGDARLDRPEHIYSTTNVMVVDEIPQTSESGTTPQGNLSGKGVGALLNPNAGRYTCKEHGCIIQLLSLVPDLSYVPQGYDRETLWKTRYETYSPEFAHISEQPLKKGELYFSGVVANDNALFGYEPAWSELRHRRNVVSGDMRDTFDYWHLARKFANQPALNEAFIKVDGTSAEFKRVFSTGTAAPGFIVDFANEFVTLRPLPKYGEPGLVDHF